MKNVMVMAAQTVEVDFSFEKILTVIQERIRDNKFSQSIENVFFSVMKEWMFILQKECPFIKYLNIFNTVGSNNPGSIEFYAEFVHEFEENTKSSKKNITSIRSEINAKEGLFKSDTYTIAKLFRENRKFGESFEYRIEKGVPKILKNVYYVAQKEKKFSYSGELKSLLETNGKKEDFEKWLKILQNCYGDSSKVSHFFLVNGPVYYGADNTLEEELSKYVVNANIGVCCKEESEKEKVFKFIRQFKKLIEQISFNLIVDIKDYQLHQAAVRAAIAQVMARNMSHNFGSHVLSNLIDDQVYEKVKDTKVVGLTNFHPDDYKKEIITVLTPAASSKEPQNHQLQYFFQYLKSRMDYLSEITFGVSNLLTTKMIGGDVMKELENVKILLNYISGVSGFSYRFELKCNNNPLETEERGVAFPSDVLGCHAFYNIIENIIRNTAKHARSKGGAPITFTIHFKDINKEDNVGVEGVDELYCVEIDNGVKEEDIDVLVEKQNERINGSVLEGNNLRSKNLGLLEMEASAAFLRQIDLPEIESEDYCVDNNNVYYHERNGKKRLNVLKAFNKNGALGYRFFMQKPKEFLFVGDWELAEETEKQLMNIGIQFISAENFRNAMTEGKAFAHQFLLYANDCTDKEEVEKFLDENNDCKTLLPLRKIPLAKEDWATISEYWTCGKQQQDTSSNKAEEWKEVLQKLKEWAWQRLWCCKANNDDESEINISCSLDDYKYQVIFLDHGSEFNNTTADIKTKIEKGDIVEAWVENMTSNTYGKLPQYNELSKGKFEPFTNYIDNIASQKGLCIELLEAYHNKVIVIDERVQEFAEKNKESGICCRDLLQSTNVCCPLSSDLPLAPTDFEKDGLKDKLEEYINNHLENAILLIHYGILERMYGNVESITKKLDKWSKTARRVVVTSGRGAHSLDLPKSVCFANLSSVLYVCNENRNKYLVNYLLNQSRRKRNE